MRLLIDTHLLIWAGTAPSRLSPASTALIGDPANILFFSAISVAEVAIKQALGRPDFQVDPRQFRAMLLGNGYAELPLNGDHALALAQLPPIHKDPFDRLLIAQAIAEGMKLVSAESQVAKYGAGVIAV